MYWYLTIPMQAHPQHQPPLPQGQHQPTMLMSPQNTSANLQPSTTTMLSHPLPTPSISGSASISTAPTSTSSPAPTDPITTSTVNFASWIGTRFKTFCFGHANGMDRFRHPLSRSQNLCGWESKFSAWPSHVESTFSDLLSRSHRIQYSMMAFWSRRRLS